MSDDPMTADERVVFNALRDADSTGLTSAREHEERAREVVDHVLARTSVPVASPGGGELAEWLDGQIAASNADAGAATTVGASAAAMVRLGALREVRERLDAPASRESRPASEDAGEVDGPGRAMLRLIVDGLDPEPCPGGCGCRWLEDADANECGCDGGCCDEGWDRPEPPDDPEDVLYSLDDLRAVIGRPGMGLEHTLAAAANRLRDAAPSPSAPAVETERADGGSCVFCDIVAGRAPATIEVQTGSSTILRPLGPVTQGHVLVIPDRHVVDAADDPDVTAQTMRDAAKYAAARHGSFNIITSAGRAATQSVFHLHVHVVPRATDDDLMVPWGTVYGDDPQAPHWCRVAREQQNEIDRLRSAPWPTVSAPGDESASESLYEQLAAIEHERWASWQRYLHSKCTVQIATDRDPGALVIPSGYVANLWRLIDTPYSDLTEREKASDREQVDRYWHLVAPAQPSTPAGRDEGEPRWEYRLEPLLAHGAHGFRCPLCGVEGEATLDDLASYNRVKGHLLSHDPTLLASALVEARSWARHGYEIGQRNAGWSDNGVAPAWLTEGHDPEALASSAAPEVTCRDCGQTVPVTRVGGVPQVSDHHVPHPDGVARVCLGSGPASDPAGERPDRVIVMAEAGGRLADVPLDYTWADEGSDAWPVARVDRGMASILEDILHGEFWVEAARLTETYGPNRRGWTTDTRPAILAVLRVAAERGEAEGSGPASDAADERDEDARSGQGPVESLLRRVRGVTPDGLVLDGATQAMTWEKLARRVVEAATPPAGGGATSPTEGGSA